MKEDVNIVHNISETLSVDLLKDPSYISNLNKQQFSINTHGDYTMIKTVSLEDDILTSFINESKITNKLKNSSSDSILYKSNPNKSNIKYLNHTFDTIILYKGNIVGFFPPQPLSFEHIKNEYLDMTNFKIREWVDSVSVCLFYNGKEWEISTSQHLKCNHKVKNKTFRQYFFECLKDAHISLFSLKKQFCYIFDIQHPDLDHICNVFLPTVYLNHVFSVYQDDGIVIEYDTNTPIIKEIFKNTNLCLYKEDTNCKTIEDVIKKYTKLTKKKPTDKGIIIKLYLSSNEIHFYRIDSSDYIYHFFLNYRTNLLTQHHLKQQYFSLRYYQSTEYFLNLYPDYTKLFESIENDIQSFTNNLYHNYCECYIYREKMIDYYDSKYTNHMQYIHEIYLRLLKPQRKSVSLYSVRKYVDTLEPSRLSYCVL